MPIDWLFGPERAPFALDDARRIRSAAGAPFHGIVSRGMLERLRKHGVPPEVWLRNAHRLFEPIAREHDADADLVALRAHADACGVLSFGDSAACVRLYLEEHCPAASAASRIEAWNVKEGHTSSVWKVSLDAAGEEVEFVLNVARDRRAGEELERTSERMRLIGQRCADINMARVLDVRTVRLRRAHDTIDAVVTRNEWVRSAYEIHSVPTEDGRRRYLLVERFLTAAGTPAQIASIYGRRFSEQECRRIEGDMSRFLKRAAEVLSEPAELDVNDGDLVWNGREGIVIAISDRPEERPS